MLQKYYKLKTNLYAINNWKTKLIEQSTEPYDNAYPMVDIEKFTKAIHELQKENYAINIITWLSRNANKEYNYRVTKAKKAWLKKHFPDIRWNKIIVLEYGTPKELYCKSKDDILFDDEENNRKNWTGTAYNVNNICEILKKTLDK